MRNEAFSNNKVVTTGLFSPDKLSNLLFIYILGSLIKNIQSQVYFLPNSALLVVLHYSFFSNSGSKMNFYLIVDPTPQHHKVSAIKIQFPSYEESPPLLPSSWLPPRDNVTCLSRGKLLLLKLHCAQMAWTAAYNAGSGSANLGGASGSAFQPVRDPGTAPLKHLTVSLLFLLTFFAWDYLTHAMQRACHWTRNSLEWHYPLKDRHYGQFFKKFSVLLTYCMFLLKSILFSVTTMCPH